MQGRSITQSTTPDQLRHVVSFLLAGLFPGRHSNLDDLQTAVDAVVCPVETLGFLNDRSDSVTLAFAGSTILVFSPLSRTKFPEQMQLNLRLHFAT